MNQNRSVTVAASFPDELFSIDPAIAREIRRALVPLQTERLIERPIRQSVLFHVAQAPELTATQQIRLAAIVTRVMMARGQGQIAFDTNQSQSDRLWGRVCRAFGIDVSLDGIDELMLVANVLTDDAQDGTPPDAEFGWLIMEQGRVFLHRDWWLQYALLQQVRRLCDSDPRWGEKNNKVAAEISALGVELSAGQSAAVEGMSAARVSLLSGGPGTGKTTVIGHVLQCLLQAASEASVPLRSCLVAPTGKAVARLSESLTAQCPQALMQQTRICTIHALLGWLPQTRRFRHHRHERLPLDVLVCDEASMVDLELMMLLLDALPDHCQVILVGDENQLSSIQPGHVFRQLWHSAEHSPGGKLRCHRLIENFRFAEQSGIARLASHILAGDAAAIHSMQEQGGDADLDWQISPGLTAGNLEAIIPDDFIAAFASSDLELMLNQINRFRVLCPVHHGPQGVDAMNRLMNTLVRQQAESSGRTIDNAQPRVVMVTRNDYRLNLFNGDQGIRMIDEHGSDVVVFEQRGERRVLPAGQIASLTDAWAMTVHKAQGSEYDRVLLLLSGAEYHALSRELVYTALTRARDHVCLAATATVVAGLGELESASSGEFRLAL